MLSKCYVGHQKLDELVNLNVSTPAISIFEGQKVSEYSILKIRKYFLGVKSETYNCIDVQNAVEMPYWPSETG